MKFNQRFSYVDKTANTSENEHFWETQKLLWSKAPVSDSGFLHYVESLAQDFNSKFWRSVSNLKQKFYLLKEIIVFFELSI